MIQINYFIKLILIYYIASINIFNNSYNLLIFRLFKNTIIKFLILFLIFIFINIDYTISILLTAFYILTNEYINIYDYNNLLNIIEKNNHIALS